MFTYYTHSHVRGVSVFLSDLIFELFLIIRNIEWRVLINLYEPTSNQKEPSYPSKYPNNAIIICVSRLSHIKVNDAHS